MARNLDWPFPGTLLRRQTQVARVSGAPCGNYALVGWPGWMGALTAVAPGRFALAVNYVEIAETIGDRIARIAGQVLEPGMPVPWATRAALDETETYDEAVKALCEANLMSPALFTVVGTRRGQACVIERKPDEYAVREAGARGICVSNHFVSEEFEDDNVDLEETTSVERLAGARQALRSSKLRTPASAIRTLSRSLFMDETTQHTVVADASKGTLTVRVPGGRSRTIEIE